MIAAWRAFLASRLLSDGSSWTAAVLLGIVSGGLYWASIPKADLGFLAWLCLIPILLAALGLRTVQALLAALIAGLVSSTGRTYWIASTLQLYGHVPDVWAVVTNALLVTYMASYWIVFVVVCRALPRRGLGFPWLAACCWVILEWIQTWMISGFPWQLLGYTQHAFLPVLQLVAITGIYGLSFLLVLVNASLAQIALGELRLRRVVLTAAIPMVLLGAVFHWGQQHLRHLDQTRIAPLKVGIIQGSVSQGRKWRPEQRQATIARYLALTRTLPADSLDLIIFPETALPLCLDRPINAPLRQRVVQLAREMDTPLLVGSLSCSNTGQVFNRAFLFDRRGQVAGYADKVHLVPFGEYLPLPWLFHYLKGLTSESGSFTPGDAYRTIQLPGTDARFGVFICFESIFPQITRKLTRLGSSFLVTTTNDAWFGDSAAPQQHFDMAIVRAVETGRAVVRVANTGISGLIDASGQVLHATDLFQTATLIMSVVPRTGQTLYVRLGDWLVGGSGLALFLSGLVALARRQRAVQQQRNRARAELEAFTSNPQPLQRPLVLLHGYRNSPESWEPLVENLERCSVNSGRWIHIPKLNCDLGLTDLAQTLDAELPEGPIDLVGHSMGGLVAVALDELRGGSETRIFTLASPLHGTWLARCALILRFPCRRQLTDMSPGSPFLARLRRHLEQCQGRLYAWYFPGDPVVPRHSALVDVAVRQLYPYPPSLRPDQRHGALCADVRVIRDIITQVQNRPRDAATIRP